MEFEIAVNIGLTIVGIVMLCYGGSWLVNGGVAIAKKFHINNIVIGMTVVAYGTSTPELAASIAAAGEHSEIILGNIIGSNIANIGIVLGITSMLAPLIAKRTTLRKEMPLMLGFSLLLIILSTDGIISQYDGIILISLLIAFTVYMYRTAISQPKDDNDENSLKKESYVRVLGLLSAGVVLLYFGAVFTIDNGLVIEQHLGISERIIGITVIAIGTSLPELLTSIIAIRKGHLDISIGNIIGSNIYNILMIMGIASMFAGIIVSDEVFYDYVIMIGFSFGLMIAMMKKIITKKMGLSFSLLYVVYILSEFLL